MKDVGASKEGSGRHDESTGRRIFEQGDFVGSVGIGWDVDHVHNRPLILRFPLLRDWFTGTLECLLELIASDWLWTWLSHTSATGKDEDEAEHQKRGRPHLAATIAQTTALRLDHAQPPSTPPEVREAAVAAMAALAVKVAVHTPCTHALSQPVPVRTLSWLR